MNRTKPCPMSLNVILFPYFQANTMWWEDEALVGRAADGQVVHIGMKGEWKRIASYLADNPRPDQW